MKGGWTGGYGDQDRDRDALAGSLHMQGGRMPTGDGWHDGGRWNEGDRWHEGGRWNEGDRWHEGGRHGDYGHHERAPWPPFGHGHGGAPAHRASSFFYETDAENRIVSLLEAGREGLKPHWYRYDAADRLLADDSRSRNDRRYSYDAADNRTSATSRTAKQTIVPNALNQMQTVNGQPTQYDAAGNLLEDEARQYDWDAEHRLIRIRYKAQAGKETRFGYDGLGRRTVITEVDGVGTTETHYVWCGEAICQKRDANGQLLRAYYPEGESGPEIGKRVAKADTATETDADGDEHDGRDQDGDDGKAAPQTESTGSLIYARNHLGSVTDTLTPDGRAVTHTEYGPYGELVKSQGRAEYRSDFGYAGMQYHAASGMYLTLFRAYDPGTGRWVSRDPIGERGGFNLYGYVGENPVSSVDPLGRSAKDVARIISSFHIITGQMTGDGLRDPNGTYNNTCRALPWLPGCPNPNRFKDCGEQTEYMNSKLDQQTYDAHWFFGLDSGFGHAWGFAYSSDPNDPVITYDTRANSISVDQNCPNCHGWFGDRMWGIDNIPGRNAGH